jgi:hypothetical protein
MTGSRGFLISHQRTPAIPGRASTDWFVTRASYCPKFRYWSRQVGRCRYERMSRYRVLSTRGCGMQSRLPSGPTHGKIVSKFAIGICFVSKAAGF